MSSFKKIFSRVQFGLFEMLWSQDKWVPGVFAIPDSSREFSSQSQLLLKIHYSPVRLSCLARSKQENRSSWNMSNLLYCPESNLRLMRSSEMPRTLVPFGSSSCSGNSAIESEKHRPSSSCEGEHFTG